MPGTTPLDALVAVDEPAPFVAVTAKRSVAPASADITVYVRLAAPKIATHEAPPASQRCHA